VSGEVTLVRETYRNRNLRKWKVSVSEHLLRVLDPSLHYIVVRRYAECLAERAGKMMNRQLCDSGEHFQSDIFLKMQVYVFAYAVDARGRKAPATGERIR
jgi:hypothetical protein